jgi:hypothetical protein
VLLGGDARRDPVELLHDLRAQLRPGRPQEREAGDRDEREALPALCGLHLAPAADDRPARRRLEPVAGPAHDLDGRRVLPAPAAARDHYGSDDHRQFARIGAGYEAP